MSDEISLSSLSDEPTGGDTPQPGSAIAPAGWYPDSQTGQQRYGDGNSWTAAYAPSAVPPTSGITTSGMAVTGFVLSLVAILSVPVLLSATTVGAIAVIFAGVGIQITRRRVKRGHALALAGVAIGVVAIIGSVVLHFILPSYTAL